MKVVVFPYRDFYFSKKYGLAVRDLHIIEALSNVASIEEIYIVNRPSLFLERVLGRKLTECNLYNSKVRFIDVTAPFFVPSTLSKRLLFNELYEHSFEKISQQLPNEIDLILDFTPSLVLSPNLKSKCVWYDAIDNFAKHNRYSAVEKKAVSSKYETGLTCVTLATGVSPGAIEHLNVARKEVLSNGLQKYPSIESKIIKSEELFDFGFIGFVTNKFDIDFVQNLLEMGHTIAIYGELYDKSIKSNFSNNSNIRFFGKFNHSEIPQICSTFKVGLIPYLVNLSHDESPLKLYQYLNNGVPVISTIEYEVKSKYVHNYKDDTHMKSFLCGLDDDLYDSVKKSCSPNWFWDSKIKSILDILGL